MTGIRTFISTTLTSIDFNLHNRISIFGVLAVRISYFTSGWGTLISKYEIVRMLNY